MQWTKIAQRGLLSGCAIAAGFLDARAQRVVTHDKSFVLYTPMGSATSTQFFRYYHITEYIDTITFPGG
jgi:hypothetical protein